MLGPRSGHESSPVGDDHIVMGSMMCGFFGARDMIGQVKGAALWLRRGKTHMYSLMREGDVSPRLGGVSLQLVGDGGPARGGWFGLRCRLWSFFPL
jgi:hypothetical protein